MKKKYKIKYFNIPFGLSFGPLSVLRLFSSEKDGSVCLGLATDKIKDPIQVHVTRAGRLRILSEEGEWAPQKKK